MGYVVTGDEVEVIPEDDLVEHEEGRPDCVCGPGFVQYEAAGAERVGVAVGGVRFVFPAGVRFLVHSRLDGESDSEWTP